VKVTVNVDSETPGPIGPGDRLGGFLLQDEIGRGGMGIVFSGIQESLNRRVAVKVLPLEMSQDRQFVGRFEREAKSLANLSHANIVGVIDKGIDRGHYYFVMEYVEGVSLRDLMDRGEMTPEKALALVPPLCDALEYAHAQGVIHRDIKPGNILINDKGVIKIADFGLARIVRGDRKEDGLTRTNLVMGTPDYMAPEQRENPKSVDHRADIYSLGVVIYEMLTGSLPLGRFDPPSRSVGNNIQLDVRLDEVVLRTLEKDRERRFQRASDVASAITGIGSAENVAAKPSAAAAMAPVSGEHGRAFTLNASSRIEVVSVDSDVVLRGCEGPAEVSGDARISASQSGNALVVQAEGGGEVVVSIPRAIPVSVLTEDNKVRGSNLATVMSVKTDEGDVEIAGLEGALRAVTDSGDITLRRLEVNDLQIKASESDVLIDGLALRSGSGSVTTDEGDVRINVDTGASSFRFRLHSQDGDVKSPLATAVASRLEGTIGAGDGWLQVESNEGDIVLDVSQAAGPRAHIEISKDWVVSKKGSGWGGFVQHLGVFVIICGALGILNYATQGTLGWSLIVAGAWGMGLGLHFWSRLVHTLMGADAQEAGKSLVMERAHKAAWKRPWVSFSRHLGSYIAVNGFLLFLNVYTGGWPTYLWCLWPAGLWGIGLALHGWSTMVKWMRQLWNESERPEPPTLDAVLANRKRVVRKAASYMSHLGVYAIVCGFIVGLNVLTSGTVSWSLFVIAGWGIGVVTGFWNSVTDVLAYISMEKAYRGARREGEAKRQRVPLLGRRKWVAALAGLLVAVALVGALNYKKIHSKYLRSRIQKVQGAELAKISKKLLLLDRPEATRAVDRVAEMNNLVCLDKRHRILLVHDSASVETYMVYPGPRGDRSPPAKGIKRVVDGFVPEVTTETYTFGTPPIRFQGIAAVESTPSHVLFVLKKSNPDEYLSFRASFIGSNLDTIMYGDALPHEVEFWRTLDTWPSHWR
jgi:predicted Ser/Thr protein kinase